MPTISQQIIDLLANSRALLVEINSAPEADLVAKIDEYIAKQSEFEKTFEQAQKVFLKNEDQLSEENLKEIITRIKDINNLLYENDKKVKDTTKQIEIDNIHQQISNSSANNPKSDELL